MKLTHGISYSLLFGLSLHVGTALPAENIATEHISSTNQEDVKLPTAQSFPRKLGKSWIQPVSSGALYGYYKEKYLIEDFWYHIALKGLSLSQDEANFIIEEVRFHSEKNNLNEKSILNQLLDECKQIAEDNKKRIGQKFDFFELTISSLFFGGGSVATFFLARAAKHDDNKLRSTVVCAFPAFLAVCGAIGLYRDLTKEPQFKERYAKYQALTNAIENALINPRKNITFY